MLKLLHIQNKCRTFAHDLRNRASAIQGVSGALENGEICCLVMSQLLHRERKKCMKNPLLLGCVGKIQYLCSEIKEKNYECIENVCIGHCGRVYDLVL